MWWILFSALAYGDADEVFSRIEEPLRMRRYAALSDTVPPKPLRRRRIGRYRVFTWPDGVIEHWEEWEAKTLLRQKTFSAAGVPRATMTYEKGLPATVSVHGRQDVDVPVKTWVSWSLGPVTFQLPQEPGEGNLLAIPKGTLRIALGPQQDVFAEEVKHAMSEACGCVLEDREPVWVDGVVGARYRLHYPGSEQNQWGETWLLPLDNGQTLYIAAITEEVTSDSTDLATARAVVSLLSLEKTP